MATHMMSTYQMMAKQKILLSHFGDINSDVTNTLLRNLKQNSGFEMEEVSKKKVYKISVECLENICRHAGPPALALDSNPSAMFLLGRDEENYHVVCGNYVDTEGIETIKKVITEINNLNKEEIKEKYKTILMQNNITLKGGAQLGIIDMALKSGNKLEYEFYPATDNVSFFIIKIQIPRI